MNTLGVYIPTYGRADKLAAVAENIEENTYGKFKLYWGVESFDMDSIIAARKTGHGVIVNHGKPCYADALQEIYDNSKEEIFLWGNDDFYFLPDWNKEPLKLMRDNKIGVLGLHDGNPNTKYSTISLVRRRYVEKYSGVVDMPNRVLYPYFHNYVDDELTETAKYRGKWNRYEGPAIEHQHHSFTWLGDFPKDATYEKNDKHFGEDTQTFYSRRYLWS